MTRQAATRPTGVGPRRTVPPGDSRRHDSGRLVGRGTELQQLEAALNRLASGVGGFLEVTGDPGFGKSRMLAETRDRARRRRMTALAGRADSGPESGAFQLFAGVLDDHLARRPEQHKLPADILEQLAPILPAIHPRGATLWAAQPAGRQLETVQALHRLLGLLAPDGMVLTLDDVHLAGATSLAALEYLVRNPVPAPLLVVVAYRPRQATLRLRAILAEGANHGHVARLTIGPLSLPEAAELLGSDVPRHRLPALHRDSVGNPRYLLMLARQDELTDPQAAADWRSDASGRLDSLLLAEVDGLSASELTVAAAAAVLAEQFTFDALAAVANLDYAQVSAGLDTLMRRDLIRPAPVGPLLSFRHPLIRKVAYAIAHPVWRVEAHRRALDWLTRNGGAAAQRAMHAAQSATAWSPEDHAVLQEAAAACLHASPADASRWLQVILGLLPSTEPYDTHRADATYLLATALGLIGQFEQSRDLLHGLLACGQSGPARMRPGAVTLCARMERMLGRYAEATALLRRETQQPVSDGSPLATSLYVEFAAAATMTGDQPAARAHAERAVAAAGSGDGGTTLASALAMLALAKVGDADRTARADVTEAAAIVDGMSDGDLLTDIAILSRLGWAELILERLCDAERHLRRGEAIARRAGHRQSLALLAIGLSRVHLLSGPLTAAVHWAEQAEHDALDIGQRDLTEIAAALQAVAWQGTGGPQDMIPLAVGRPLLPSLRARDSWLAQEAFAALISAAYALGPGADEARLLLRSADAPDPARLPVPVRARYLDCRISAAVAVGDLAAAEEYLAGAQEAAAASGLTGQRACLLRAQATVLTARSDAEGAARALAASSDGFAEVGLHIDHARADLALALALRRCGRLAEAGRAAERAAETAARAGARRLAGPADQLGQALRMTVQRPSGDPFAALTEREGEVARLVGIGGTSRQIAQQLHLSTRTVDTHLARIYRKLDLSSRSALARLVEREVYGPTMLGG